MGSESIGHEAEGRMGERARGREGERARGREGERNNCFSKVQLVGQK